jgi:hypothetical protein
MTRPESTRALNTLLRVAILGITQSIAALVACVMLLVGCGPDAIMLAMLAHAVVGIVAGDRAVRPRRGGAGPSRPGAPHGPSAPRLFASGKNRILS